MRGGDSSNSNSAGQHKRSSKSGRRNASSRRRASDAALTPDEDEDEPINSSQGIREDTPQDSPNSGGKSNRSKESEMDLNVSPESMRERAMRRRSHGNAALSVSSEFLQLSHGESILGYDESYPPPPGGYDDEDEDEDAMELVVETLTGDSYRVRVSPWDTAAGLKGLLYRTQG
ncbi:unnamed protein product, partial [Meganyctiphanes norvegica]